MRGESQTIQALDIPVGNAVAYLELVGWQRAKSASDRWTVLHGPADYEGRPLELVFPHNERAPDRHMYVQTALHLLSELAQEAPEKMALRIRCYDRDVLRLRNVYTSSSLAIPLTQAANQIYELRQLIGYGGSTEYNPRPNYDQISAIGQRLATQCQFGHTFAGSFGFTIESPIVNKKIVYTYEQQPLPYAFEDLLPIQEAPFERRVMERIVRGLRATQQSAEQGSSVPLIEEYAVGFNANMCRAVYEMGDKLDLVLEYDVMWSPKIEPSPEIATTGPIEVPSSAYDYLQRAYEELRDFKPLEEYITGVVMALSSKDDPLRVNEAERAVVIHWRNRQRPVQLLVRLTPEEYILAHKAHLEWKTVSIFGVANRVNRMWTLSEPRDFRITD